jgi:hypothetical protein
MKIPKRRQLMLAEVRLLIGKNEARLLLKDGDEILEDELWKFDVPLQHRVVSEAARAMFGEAYDYLQYMTHGE